MSDREPLAPELKAVEAALASLAPTSATSADRDRLMFAAGRSAEKSRILWINNFATIVLVFAAFYLGQHNSRPTVMVAEPVVPKLAALASNDEPSRLPASPSSYLQLRRHLDRIDAVAVTAGQPTSTAGSTSRQDLLRELIN